MRGKSFAVFVWIACCGCQLLEAGLPSAETARYRTITPRIGDPFDLRQGFEVIEPRLADTDQPLPGWRGEGHMIGWPTDGYCWFSLMKINAS